jgi:hypothetical protein
MYWKLATGRWEAIRKQTYARFERMLSETPRFPTKRTIGIIEKLQWEFLLTTPRTHSIQISEWQHSKGKLTVDFNGPTNIRLSSLVFINMPRLESIRMSLAFG